MPGRIEKTVFISYRRTNLPWALAIYQDLHHNGYDVFFDYLSIDSGNFEKVIIENIKTRAHFVVILTPSALERCNEPGDWLRREIETAMDEKRNIVPLMLESFDFGSPLVKQALTGKLALLNQYNGLSIPAEYFLEAMDRLRERYLRVSLIDIALPVLKDEAIEITESHQAAANEAPPVEKEELTAQEWYERGYVFQESNNLDEAIRCYSKALDLMPDLLEAYNNRGVAHRRKGEIDEAIRNFDRAIQLKADYPDAFNNRANVRGDMGDLDGAISDYNEAIRLNPYHAEAFNNRSDRLKLKGDLDGAIRDSSEAIRLRPEFAEAFNNRGNARREKGDFEDAIHDFDEAIRLKPELAEPYNNRGIARAIQGELDGSIQDFTKAISIDPNYADAFYNRALSWEQKENYSEAVADYQAYLELGGGIRSGDQKEVEEIIKKLKANLTTKRARKKKSK